MITSYHCRPKKADSFFVLLKIICYNFSNKYFYMFTFFTIPPFASAIASLILGLFVFSSNKKKGVNIAFLLIGLVTFWWQFCWFILFNTSDAIIADFLVRLGYVGIIFIPITLYHFFLRFFEVKSKLSKASVIVTYIAGIFFVSLLFTSDLFIDGYYHYFWGFYPKAGIFHPVYLLFLTVLSLRLLQLSWKNLKAQKFISAYKYQQTKYVLLALVFYIFAASDFLVNYGYEFFPFGFFFIFCFLGIFAYAIIRHRLMDIKMVLRGSSVYLSSLITTLFIAVLINWLSYHYFAEEIYWVNLLILIFCVSVFPSIKNKYFFWANKYFFSSLYDPQKLIAEVSENLRTTLQVDTIYRHIFDSLDKAFHLKAFGVLSYDETEKIYELDFNMGFETGGNNRFEHNKKLHNLFIGHNKTMITEELRKYYYKKDTKETIDMLTALKVEVLIPLNIKDRTVGLIALGAKESNDVYTDIDLQALEIVGAQAATVIENAHLYEETINFNLKLKDEVAKATRNLLAANKKLIKLDEAKSEFISIASHQLRTPLTIIKGYISMILEGNFGELTPGEKDSLEKVYASNERLIQLVENLLNISRIESGRLQYEFKPIQLDDLVDSVVEELEPKAKGKGLRFSYKRPKKKMPAVIIDEEKVRQVVMNLVDNAIKYTKKGSVTVSLKPSKSRDKKIGNCLEFCVTDSGMGISEEDLPNLFKKFSRGTGSSLIHTEGTGLGLYVAKQMIEAHQGRIWAESVGENKGSKFCFKLSTKKTPPPNPSEEEEKK